MTAPTVRLHHGGEMPQLGLGTWPMNDTTAERVVADALGAGYRLVDTAELYGNEVGVGRGIRASGVDRSELFVTTKLSKRWHGRELAAQACDASLERLGLDYLDLLLIHWPNPSQDGYVQAWEGLINLQQSGRVKAIGTSNFKPAHLQRIIDGTSVVPDVNQIQLSPALTRDTAREFHTAHGIVTESWSPIGGQGIAVLDEPVVTDVAAQTGRTAAQVVLRWHIELGLVTVPKSADPTRLRENLNIFDFALTAEQISALSSLDRGEQAASDSDHVGY